MRRNTLGNVGAFSRLVNGSPDDLRRNRDVGAPVVDHAWKQVCPRLQPTPVLSQGVQQLRSQEDIAIVTALAVTDANDHPLAVDIGNSELAQLAAAHKVI